MDKKKLYSKKLTGCLSKTILVFKLIDNRIFVEKNTKDKLFPLLMIYLSWQ